MSEQPVDERRAVVRAPCVPEAQAYVGEFYEGLPRWARVLDASPGGLGLLLPASFRPGALLVVDLRGPGQRYSAVGRVRHATACPDGNYRVGCSLNSPLPAGVLDMLTAPAAGPVPEGGAALAPVAPS
jgi:hypothetical protein